MLDVTAHGDRIVRYTPRSRPGPRFDSDTAVGRFRVSRKIEGQVLQSHIKGFFPYSGFAFATWWVGFCAARQPEEMTSVRFLVDGKLSFPCRDGFESCLKLCATFESIACTSPLCLPDSCRGNYHPFTSSEVGLASEPTHLPVWTDISNDLRHTSRTEPAFKRADAGVEGIRRQLPLAMITGRPEISSATRTGPSVLPSAAHTVAICRRPRPTAPESFRTPSGDLPPTALR